MARTKSEKETFAAAVEVYVELTESELRERHRLELRVESGFYQAGAALCELRDRRLYRSTHKTFEEYCKQRFGYNRSRSYQMINAALVVDNLKECPQIVDKLPKSESQCRPLTKLTPQQQRQAWTTLLKETGGSIPTGSEVKAIVERIKEKPLVLAADFCEVGDVFILTKLEGTERKYNGCWGIASDTHGITVGIDVHDGSLRVKPENLRRIDSPEIHRTLPAIHRRIKRLRKCGKLDRSAEVMLSHIGRQTYLTDLEEKIFHCMEQHCGIDELN